MVQREETRAAQIPHTMVTCMELASASEYTATVFTPSLCISSMEKAKKKHKRPLSTRFALQREDTTHES